MANDKLTIEDFKRARELMAQAAPAQPTCIYCGEASWNLSKHTDACIYGWVLREMSIMGTAASKPE